MAEAQPLVLASLFWVQSMSMVLAAGSAAVLNYQEVIRPRQRDGKRRRKRPYRAPIPYMPQEFDVERLNPDYCTSFFRYIQAELVLSLYHMLICVVLGFQMRKFGGFPSCFISNLSTFLVA